MKRSTNTQQAPRSPGAPPSASTLGSKRRTASLCIHAPGRLPEPAPHPRARVPPPPMRVTITEKLPPCLTVVASSTGEERRTSQKDRRTSNAEQWTSDEDRCTDDDRRVDGRHRDCTTAVTRTISLSLAPCLSPFTRTTAFLLLLPILPLFLLFKLHCFSCCACCVCCACC